MTKMQTTGDLMRLGAAIDEHFRRARAIIPDENAGRFMQRIPEHPEAATQLLAVFAQARLDMQTYRDKCREIIANAKAC